MVIIVQKRYDLRNVVMNSPHLVESAYTRFWGAMDIEFIHDNEAFDRLRTGWDALLPASSTDAPFLRHSFLWQWWRTLGGGEWEQGELSIAVGREKGIIRAIAPLFKTSTSGRSVLLFLGSIEISDYLDIIAAPPELERFAANLLAALEAQGVESPTPLDLYNIPAASPTRAAFAAAAAERGWVVRESTLQPCPAVALPSTWDTYLAGLEKKQRHEIRRKVRRADEQQLAFKIARDEATLEHGLNGMLALMKTDPRKAVFLKPAMEEQFRDSARAAFQEGWLQLAMLRAGGELASAYLNFDYNGKLWVYNSAINPDYYSASAGWVLLARIIQWAIENKKSELDFLRGDERYKYRFGGVDRELFRLEVFRPM